MTPQHEQFAQLVSRGASQIDAYRKASGSNAKAESAYVSASEWGAKTRLRVEELRAALKDRNTTEYVYEYEDAMRECDEALEMAKIAADSSAMSKAIALKAKLSGLETEPRQNKRAPFEDLTEEELVAGINQAMDQAGFTIQ